MTRQEPVDRTDRKMPSAGVGDRTRQRRARQSGRELRFVRTPTEIAPAVPITPEDTDRRLTDLEIKASFAEDLLDELNRLVARQQDQIDLLRREVAELRRQGPPPDAPGERDPRDELPPHY